MSDPTPQDIAKAHDIVIEWRDDFLVSIDQWAAYTDSLPRALARPAPAAEGK